MGRYNRIYLIAVLTILPAMLFAQFNNNTTSPYSRFGLGEINPGTFGRSSAMAGANLGSRNNLQINFNNPASYTSVDSLAFLFEFGFNAKFSEFKNDISSSSSNNINFNYFAFGFPISKKIGASFGLTPYSDSGYEVQMIEEVENFGKVWHRYHGEGSLSRAYLGFGYEPIKNISIGANIYYFFGTLTRNADVGFIEAADLYSIQRDEIIRIRDFGISYGLQATFPLKAKQKITLGATLEYKPTFTAFHSDLTLKNLSTSSQQNQDTVLNIAEEKDKIRMPLTYGIGISYTDNEKLEVNADYIHQGWAKAKFFGESNPILTNLDRIAIGAEFIPDKYSIRSYLKRVAYRAGFKYEKSYLLLNGQQINDIGISFGVGLPVYRSASLINLSAEIGKRGKTSFNLIRENYAKLTMSINLYDIWFVKRRFD
jgi:hypothetical protein